MWSAMRCNPAIALWLQSTRLVGRVAESFGGERRRDF